MSGFAPGSIAWLLRHELRLTLRRSSRKAVRSLVVIGVVLALLTASEGVPLAYLWAHRRLSATPAISMAVCFAAVILFTLMLSQALMMSARAFFERGDLDLLLSSPLPPGRVLLVRCLAIAVSVPAVYFLFVTPVLLPLAVSGHWPLLAVYPLLAALSLVATAAGLVMATVLFATLGPRRTRTVAQVLAAVVGASAFLVFEAGRLSPDFGHLIGRASHEALREGWFGAGSFLSWPARAALGAPGPLAAVTALATTAFAGASARVGKRFAADAAAAAGTGVRPRRRRTARRLRFRGGVTPALIRKELRLIGHDPALWSQVLLRALYLIPLTFLVVQGAASSGGAHEVVLGMGALTVFAGVIAADLAWITMSAEDVPDLLRSAPVSDGAIRRAKLAAALLPVAVLTSPVLALLWFHPWPAFVGILGIGASSLSNGFIQLWYQKPAPRGAFRRRARQSYVATFGGMLVSLGWAALVTVAGRGTKWALLIAVVVALVLAGLMGLLWLGRHREPPAAYRRQLDVPAPPA